ncbi:MAG: helix-turn-helix transcriptional regulator [Rhodovibrionaceae bacterium]
MILSGTDTIDKLEEIVMLALVRLEPNAYGVVIRDLLSEKADRNYSFATVYKVLDRLERKGFVSSFLGEPTAERGGRAKRYYKVEARGIEALNADRKAIERLRFGISAPGLAV